jgi:hypothetical protein
MTGDQVATDPGAEREIDLRVWLDAVRAYWWIAVAGLVVGVVIGGVYAVSGSAYYVASATIARPQVFNPAGTSQVLPYLSSPAQIESLATSADTLDKVAAKIGMTRGELRGHVTTSTVSETGTSSTTNTNSILILITVKLNKPKRAEEAATAIAEVIKAATKSNYVTASLATYEQRDASFTARIGALRQQIQGLNDVLAHTTLQPLNKLVLVSQLEQAQAALGQTIDSQTTNQQDLILARDVETTQIVPPPPRALKTTLRSPRNAVLFGGLIGFLIGALVALIVGLRAARPTPA